MFTASLPIWRRIIYIVCGFTVNEKVKLLFLSITLSSLQQRILYSALIENTIQDIDLNDKYGYKTGPKTAKEKAKEAVEALHEPDHWQRYLNLNILFHNLTSLFFVLLYPYVLMIEMDFFRFLNINAVVLMTITCFVIGFYW